MNDYEEKIGPVVHVPRSELMCIRCKYLRGRLKDDPHNILFVLEKKV